MNARLLYELRGWAYWAKCLNPFRNTISIRNLPLGLRLEAYKRDAVGRGLFRRKIHEPALTNYLLTRFAKPADRNFIDIGANIGYFTGLLSKLAGGGRVLAIEPEPDNLRLLRENIKNNRLANVVIFPCAVGASSGSAPLGLYKAANRGRHSMVEAKTRSRIIVPVRTLDDLVREAAGDVASWSLVKIDVEGYEGFVMEGMSGALQRIETLVLEYSPVLWKKSGLEASATFRRLATHFSRFYRIAHTGLNEVSPADCQTTDEQMELIFER